MGAPRLERSVHPHLGAYFGPLALLHVLAAFAFVLLHGPSVAAMLQLRRERELAKVQALLTMSRSASQLSWIAWVALALTGALLAWTAHAWRAPWVWGSAVVLVATTLAMSPLAARAFNEARHAAGLPYFDGRREARPSPHDPVALARALDVIRARALPVTLVGVVGLAALVWLMVERPG